MENKSEVSSYKNLLGAVRDYLEIKDNLKVCQEETHNLEKQLDQQEKELRYLVNNGAIKDNGNRIQAISINESTDIDKLPIPPEVKEMLRSIMGETKGEQ